MEKEDYRDMERHRHAFLFAFIKCELISGWLLGISRFLTYLLLLYATHIIIDRYMICIGKCTHVYYIFHYKIIPYLVAIADYTHVGQLQDALHRRTLLQIFCQIISYGFY